MAGGSLTDESYLPKSGAPSHSCLLSTPVDKPFDLTYLTQIVGMALQDKLA